MSTSINSSYITEMNEIDISIESYPAYKNIATYLQKYGISENIIAGLLGCIIPESGGNHRVLNEKEFKGKGASGTNGWNCGEGLIQWTYWKYKLPLITNYNKDSRTTQKLPTIEATYLQGSPHYESGILVSTEDGKHISGLSLENQVIFLILYYDKLIKSLADETNIAVITAKIYQQKAGQGFYKDITDPIDKAYMTAKKLYNGAGNNHYLKSLKVALEYSGSDLVSSSDVNTYTNSMSETLPSVSSGSNKVYLLASSSTRTDIKQLSDDRMKEFQSLQTAMISNTPELGRDIIFTEEMYDSNILKSGQESKNERFKKNTDV